MSERERERSDNLGGVPFTGRRASAPHPQQFGHCCRLQGPHAPVLGGRPAEEGQGRARAPHPKRANGVS
eukprot:5929086-Pyramimonas_sp.AAC.1